MHFRTSKSAFFVERKIKKNLQHLSQNLFRLLQFPEGQSKISKIRDDFVN